MNPIQKPSSETDPESVIPELDFHQPDESDFEVPGIMPSKPSSMPRAEDDPKTFERSPEFHDRKAPEHAQLHKGPKNGHTWE